MSTILYSTAQIGDAYAPSLNAAFAEIFQASGIKPLVLSPNGGQRTVAQEKTLGGTAASDHVKKRAVDIDNQRQLRNWNEARFLAILASHGWHNVTEAGKQFPSEPWHFANQSSAPAGGDTTSLDNTPPPFISEDPMICIGLDYGKPSAVAFSIGVGILQRCETVRAQQLAASQGQGAACYWYADDDFLVTMINHGLGEFSVADARALTGSGHLVAKAIYGTGATVTVDDATAAKIGAAVKVPAPDTPALSAQLAALAKQGTADQAALLAAIGQVDENTLATFGLKRA